MSDCVKVTKIIVNLAGQETQLTIDQAKALRTQLNELFGQQVVERHHHHTHRYRPYWEYRIPYVDPCHPTWCSSDTPLQVSYQADSTAVARLQA